MNNFPKIFTSLIFLIQACWTDKTDSDTASGPVTPPTSGTYSFISKPAQYTCTDGSSGTATNQVAKNLKMTISGNTIKLAPADQAAEDRELAASGITANVTGYSGLLFAPTNPRFLERNNPKRCECRGEREKLNCQRQLKFLFTERLARGIKRVLCHI